MKDIFLKYGILKNALNTFQAELLENCIREAREANVDAFNNFAKKYNDKLSKLKESSQALRHNFSDVLNKAEKALGNAIPPSEISLLSAFEKAKKAENVIKDSLILDISEKISELLEMYEYGASLLALSFSDLDVEYRFRKIAIEEYHLHHTADFFANHAPHQQTEAQKAEISELLQNIKAVIAGFRTLTLVQRTKDTVSQLNAIRECMRLIHGFTDKSQKTENV